MGFPFRDGPSAFCVHVDASTKASHDAWACNNEARWARYRTDHQSGWKEWPEYSDSSTSTSRWPAAKSWAWCKDDSKMTPNTWHCRAYNLLRVPADFADSATSKMDRRPA